MNFLAIFLLGGLVYISSTTTSVAIFYTLTFLKAFTIMWFFMDLKVAKEWALSVATFLAIFFFVMI